MNLEDTGCNGLNLKDKIHEEEEGLLRGQGEDSSSKVCTPIETISNATVANRKGIFRATAPKTHATTNCVLSKEGEPKPMTTTNRTSPY